MNSSFALVAIQAALQAGELLKKGFGSPGPISSKKGRHDLVTMHDKASETMIKSCITQAFPDHTFLAEESGISQGKNTSVTWVIDPLDGTVNFAHGIPYFCISIAVLVNNIVVAAIIHMPMTGELFVAEKGKGAFLNGSLLSVSTTKDPKDAFLATDIPYNAEENPGGCIDSFSKIMLLGTPVRRIGSAASALAYVAAGKLDGYWEISLQPWDVAAGLLLIEEAGGKVSHYDGSPHTLAPSSTIIASNTHLHPWMIEQMKP